MATHFIDPRGPARLNRDAAQPLELPAGHGKTLLQAHDLGLGALDADDELIDRHARKIVDTLDTMDTRYTRLFELVGRL